MPACISNHTVWPLGPIMQRAGFLPLPMTALDSPVTQGHTKQAHFFFSPRYYTYFKPMDFVLYMLRSFSQFYSIKSILNSFSENPLLTLLASKNMCKTQLFWGGSERNFYGLNTLEISIRNQSLDFMWNDKHAQAFFFFFSITKVSSDICC